MAPSSEHLGRLEQRRPHLRPLTHTHPAQSHTRETHTTRQGKVAGSKVLAGSNFGIEIAGEQKGTALGLETWLLGLQAAHRLRGAAVRLLCSLSSSRSSCRAWNCQLLGGGGTPLITARGLEGRPEPEAQYMLGPLPPPPGHAGRNSPFTAHFLVSAWWSGPPCPRLPRWAPFLQQLAGPQLLWRPCNGVLDTGCPQRHTVQTDLATQSRVLFGMEGGGRRGEGG